MTSSSTPDPADDVSLSWGFTDTASAPASSGGDTTTNQSPEVLLGEVVGGIHDTLPPAWSFYLTEIAIAADEHRTRAAVETPDGRLLPLTVGPGVLRAAAAHRELTAGESPWMWLRITEHRGGEPQIAAFDGFVGAPPQHLLFPPASYRADVSMSTAATTPLWLLAHVHDAGRQLRSASTAAAASPAECVYPTDELPPLPILWPRFAALSAIFAAVDAVDGPRMTSAVGIFRGELGGCTLTRLPCGRAVLSGGADHSTLLTAAYQGQLEHPDLYRGAPAWVSNIVLDERAAAGMLTFCYWWSDGRWSRADLVGPPEWTPVTELASAVPGVWTSVTTAELVRATLGRVGIEVSTDAAWNYVAQVDAGNIRPDLLATLPHPPAAPAEGLAVLDLTQPW
ncbi:hypothetical protein ACLQ3C_20410 [Gordonia sp. DT30]|uniref:hypothetical protein n=1 Tax=Gordonia sp. DT30 TaxID=3416546 RepID=UPI003CF9EE63